MEPKTPSAPPAYAELRAEAAAVAPTSQPSPRQPSEESPRGEEVRHEGRRQSYVMSREAVSDVAQPELGGNRPGS